MTKKSRRVAKARRVLFTLSLVLVTMVVAVGGTIAWLTSTTTSVVNTFTPAGVEIALTETWNTDADGDETNESWTAQLIPGKTYTKDPYVHVIRADSTDANGKTVKGTNVDIYLFVKFEETVDESVLTYNSLLNSDNGWTAGTGETITNEDGTTSEGNKVPVGVWYRKVAADYNTDADGNAENGISFQLLANNSVEIKDTVTKDKTNVGGTMTYTAYAIQVTGTNGVEFTPGDAWQNVPKE